MKMHISLCGWALALIAMSSSALFAQLPAEVKSDLGPDVPALRVRPGYRVTRAVPDDAIRPGGKAAASQPSQAQRRVRRGARFLQFSADGKTLFLSQSENGTI